MGMILRIASSRIVGQGDIVGRSGYFSLNLSANSVMRGRLDARRTLKSLVADLRVNKFIKEMAENMPVIISTHNNTIGGSIKPDYILYTEKKIEADGVHFNIYSGYPTAQTLRDVKGNTIENYEITLNSLEAGEQAYSERKDIYETLKN